MPDELNAKDRLLLDILSRDARRPVVALARDLGLSRSATQERLRRLERIGVIQGYAVRTRQGTATQAWMQVNYEAGFACAQVTPRILALPAVRLCHGVAGPIDLLVLIEVGSLDQIPALRDQLASIAGVAHVETYPVLAVHLAC